MQEKDCRDLIQDTEKWIFENHYGQSMIFLDPAQKLDFDLPQKKPSESTVTLKDLYPSSFFQRVEILLIMFSQDKQEEQMMEKMAKAIDERIAKARLIKADVLEENELFLSLFHDAKSLKHVIISELEFYRLKSLQTHYQKQPERRIFDAKLFFLADLKSYSKDLTLKKALWATLLREL